MRTNIIKTLLFLIVAIVLSSNKLLAQKSIQPLSNNEIRFGVGFFPISNFSGHHGCADIGYNMGLSDTYKGNRIYLPALNLSYSYQFKKWIAFGANLSYSGTYQNEYKINNDKLAARKRDHYIGITPTVRFDWVNSKIVKLYSAVGIGLGINIEKDNTYDYDNYKATSIYPSLDISFIGITVGRKVFGLCELGVGTHGIIKVGVGYRFNDKK